MRFEGTLTVWNPERGYGAIQPEKGGQEVFVHISAFPLDSPPPVGGEALSFEIVSSGDGRKQAARVQRSRRPAPSPHQRFMAPAPDRGSNGLARRQTGRRRRIAFAVVGTVLVVGVLTLLQVVAQPGGGNVQAAQKAIRVVR